VCNLGSRTWELFALDSRPPPPFPKKKKKKLAWKLTIQVENEKWTVHSPHTKHNLKYKTPLPPPTSKKREAL